MAEDGMDWRQKREDTDYSDPQWLQRLLDSPREEQLKIVADVRTAAQDGVTCHTARHGEVIVILREHSIRKTRLIRELQASLSQEPTEASEAADAT